MILRGIPASPGIAIGSLFLFESFQPKTDRRQIDNAQAELQRYSQAVTTAARDLDQVRAKAEKEIGVQEAAIFSAQALMLQDPELTKSIQEMIVKEHVNAERASCLWQRRGNNAIVPPEPVPSEPLRDDEGGVEAEPRKRKWAITLPRFDRGWRFGWMLPLRSAQGQHGKMRAVCKPPLPLVRPLPLSRGRWRRRRRKGFV
ncbi:MAG: hypothetical protein M1347_03475 [Chloroflexi bacterium]|nr:hypothetical protein [Chloroflexota bacterium]